MAKLPQRHADNTRETCVGISISPSVVHAVCHAYIWCMYIHYTRAPLCPPLRACGMDAGRRMVVRAPLLVLVESPYRAALGEMSARWHAPRLRPGNLVAFGLEAPSVFNHPACCVGHHWCLSGCSRSVCCSLLPSLIQHMHGENRIANFIVAWW